MKTKVNSVSSIEKKIVAPKVHIEPIVVNQLIKDTGSSVFANILDLFIEETRLRIARISSAYGNGDHLTIKNEAHAIKSSAATIGAITLSGLARTLEQDSKQETFLQLESIVASLLGIANHTFEELHAHWEKHCD